MSITQGILLPGAGLQRGSQPRQEAAVDDIWETVALTEAALIEDDCTVCLQPAGSPCTEGSRLRVQPHRDRLLHRLIRTSGSIPEGAVSC